MSAAAVSIPSQLKKLGLTFAALRASCLIDDADTRNASERLAELLQAELDGRAVREQQRREAAARLPIHGACVEDCIAASAGRLKAADVAHLRGGRWIGKRQHVVVVSPAGGGKTSLACALANEALQAGYRVRYFDVPDLIAAWGDAELGGGLHTFRRELARTDLLVLDDWGVEPLDEQDVVILRRVLHERTQKASVMLVTPLPAVDWAPWLGGGEMAESLSKRLQVSHALTL